MDGLQIAQQIFILLILFEIKHYFADWQFQTPYMVEGKRKAEAKDFCFPLLAHASVHGALTFLIVAAYLHDMVLGIGIAFTDTVFHFGIDRVKSSPHLFGKYDDMTKSSYWILLGADQAAHHFCYFVFIYVIIKTILMP